ncbi:hypothetical protein KAJ27_15830 [bacterium]|nr:hypothetical protein [bacterium]
MIEHGNPQCFNRYSIEDLIFSAVKDALMTISITGGFKLLTIIVTPFPYTNSVL